jgi:hypothetical protein
MRNAGFRTIETAERKKEIWQGFECQSASKALSNKIWFLTTSRKGSLQITQRRQEIEWNGMNADRSLESHLNSIPC